MGIFFNKALNKITIQLLQKETSFPKISIEETMLDVRDHNYKSTLRGLNCYRVVKIHPFVCLFLSETDVK